MAFTLRIFLAIGCTASTTASFAITANTFPDTVATVFGLLETATGLGMMLGPALGGVLYEVCAINILYLDGATFVIFAGLYVAIKGNLSRKESDLWLRYQYIDCCVITNQVIVVIRMSKMLIIH